MALSPTSCQSSTHPRVCPIAAAAAPLCQASRLYDGSSSRAQCGTRGWLSVVNRPLTWEMHVVQSQVAWRLRGAKAQGVLRESWVTLNAYAG